MSAPFCYADGQERFWRAYFHDAIYLGVFALVNLYGPLRIVTGLGGYSNYRIDVS